MPRPGVNIGFENGNLGIVSVNPDGVMGLVSSAATAGTFELNKHYVIFSLEDAEALGILPSVDNYALHKTIAEFYAETGKGAELWIFGVARTRTLDQLIDDSKALLTASNRRLRGVMCKYLPSAADNTVEDGLRTDFPATIAAAQTIAEDYLNDSVHPFVFVLEGYNFTGVSQDLVGFAEGEDNRVMVMIGDTDTRTGAPASMGAAIGVLGGRIAATQVHQNIGRVKSGPLAPLQFYIGDVPAERYNVDPLIGKGFVTLVTHVGKTGFYFSDDPMACTEEDDYHFLTRRRTIDKAYVLAYSTLTNEILENIPVTGEGTMQASYGKALEAEVERVITQEMTAKGELSADPTIANDTGVECIIDTTEKIVSTSKIKGRIRVRPQATGRYFEFTIGFNINS